MSDGELDDVAFNDDADEDDDEDADEDDDEDAEANRPPKDWLNETKGSIEEVNMLSLMLREYEELRVKFCCMKSR